jgi:salicylate biosynthesis isochorismate synthase
MSVELASASSVVASGDRQDWERVQHSTLALLDAARAEQAILVLSIAAPLVDIEEALRLRSGDAVLWAPGKGPELVGLGVCHEITGSGRERFIEVRSKAEALLRRVRVVAASELMPPFPPVLLGGFAFQAGHAHTSSWRGFGDARFILPKVSYVRDERRAMLRLALAPEELRVETVRGELLALERLRSELGVLEQRSAPLTAKPRLIGSEELGEAAFTRWVEAILAGIRRGEFEKVVAARSVSFELSPAPDPVRVLARLREQAPECTRFAIRRGAATFLGATPERLASLRAGVVETEALAGSIRAGDPARRAELLDSSKEREEHELVAGELVRRLEALATEIRRPDQPGVRSLRHVLHLWTPIRAVLREPLHVLDLVERLHPTPAVGGVPTAGALSFIAEHEPGERGWYAGPIGWCDARGEGEFSVALRSGLLEGSRANLYAGAGIVRASNAHSEWLETRLKLMALTSALGLDPEELARERS